MNREGEDHALASPICWTFRTHLQSAPFHNRPCKYLFPQHLLHHPLCCPCVLTPFLSSYSSVHLALPLCQRLKDHQLVLHELVHSSSCFHLGAQIIHDLFYHLLCDGECVVVLQLAIKQPISSN